MRVIRLPAHPRYAQDSYAGWTCEALEPKQLRPFAEIGADTVIYWYATCCYSGAGHAFYRVDHRWYLHDMGHRICYGPTDSINAPHLSGGAELPYTVFSHGTEDLQDLTRSLFLAALSVTHKKGKKPNA